MNHAAVVLARRIESSKASVAWMRSKLLAMKKQAEELKALVLNEEAEIAKWQKQLNQQIEKGNAEVAEIEREFRAEAAAKQEDEPEPEDDESDVREVVENPVRAQVLESSRNPREVGISAKERARRDKISATMRLRKAKDRAKKPKKARAQNGAVPEPEPPEPPRDPPPRHVMHVFGVPASHGIGGYGDIGAYGQLSTDGRLAQEEL